MSLIEVMVAVFILASGLLGLGALQARSLQFNLSAHNRSVAADLAADLAERIRANRSPFMSDVSASPLPPMPPNFALCTLALGVVTCTAQPTVAPKHRETYQVSAEMTSWFATLSNQLPGAAYALTAAEGGSYPYGLTYTLTITWPDNRGNITAEDNADFSYVTVIE